MNQPFIINQGDITGSKVTILGKCGGGLVGSEPILAHHLRTLDTQLTRLVDADGAVAGFTNIDLCRREWSSNTAHNRFKRIINGDRWRGLSESVSFNNFLPCGLTP